MRRRLAPLYELLRTIVCSAAVAATAATARVVGDYDGGREREREAGEEGGWLLRVAPSVAPPAVHSHTPAARPPRATPVRERASAAAGHPRTRACTSSTCSTELLGTQMHSCTHELHTRRGSRFRRSLQLLFLYYYSVLLLSLILV